MKVSKEQALLNREKVIAAAAGLYRERGLSGIGLADLCRSVGLTHGGLYNQFPGGKEELAVLAIQRVFEDANAYWSKIPDLPHVMLDYMAAGHCTTDRPCPIPTLAADVSRLGGDVEQAFSRGVTEFLNTLTELSTASTELQRKQEAAQALASAVGAVLISRALANAKDGEAFLELVKARWTE